MENHRRMKKRPVVEEPGVIKRHGDTIALGSLVIAVAGFMVISIGWNRDDIREVRGDVKALSGEFRISTDRIIDALSEIKANTAVTKSEVDRNKEDVKKATSLIHDLKLDVLELGHQVEKASLDSDQPGKPKTP